GVVTGLVYVIPPARLFGESHVARPSLLVVCLHYLTAAHARFPFQQHAMPQDAAAAVEMMTLGVGGCRGLPKGEVAMSAKAGRATFDGRVVDLLGLTL